MSKIGAVIIVVGIVIAAYLLLLIVIPSILVPAVSTANITMAATSNMSNYPGTGEMTVATPWVMFFVPGAIGMVAIVVILKKP